MSVLDQGSQCREYRRAAGAQPEVEQVINQAGTVSRAASALSAAMKRRSPESLRSHVNCYGATFELKRASLRQLAKGSGP
jgi:hypothetical protein